MAAHRKFTFDDPEDSYWNQNARSAFFDDAPSTSNAVSYSSLHLTPLKQAFCYGLPV